MPRIRRYHPVSHDLNRDPEMWQFRELVGPRADAIWLEILSIADRNDGYLPGNFGDYPRLLAGACHSTPSRVRLALQWLSTPRGRRLQPWVLVDYDPGMLSIARVVNYSDFHKTREPKQAPSEHPNLPNLPNKHKEDIYVDANADDQPALKLVKKKPDMSVKEFVESWNDVFDATLPAVEWPLSKSRHGRAAARLKEHPTMEFWEKVFRNIGSSDFLTGKRTDWRCNFDFLIKNDTNATKIYEGSYDNGKSEQRQGFNRAQNRR